MSNRLDQLIRGGLLAMIVFTALAHGAVESWSLALFELVVAALLLSWGAKVALDKELRISVPAVVIPLAALLLVGTVQSLAVTDGSGQRGALSLDVETTRSTVLALFFLLVAMMIASNFLGTANRLRAAANFLVVFGLVMAVFSLVQHFSSDGRFYWLRPNTQSVAPFGPFANHNHFAGFMEMPTLLAAGMVATRAVRREARLLYGFAAAMMGVAIMASLSRGGIISLGLGLLFLVALSARVSHRERLDQTEGWPDQFARRKRLFASARHATASGAIAVAIVAGVLWIGSGPLVIERAAQTIDQATPADPQDALSGRKQVWLDTIAMIRANPLLGVGLGAYKTAYPNYSTSNGAIEVGQAHNDFLQAVADCGIPGAIVAAWFIVVVFRAVVRGASCGDRVLAGLALGGGSGIFALLVHSLFDFNLQIPSNALLFLVLAALVSQVDAIAAARIGAHGSSPA